MTIRVRRFLLAVLLAAVAIAAAAEGASHPAVVRIRAQGCGGQSCGISYGSGTVVDVDGTEAVVLTCAHLFRDKVGSVTCEFPDGTKVAAEVQGVDATWDLAALTISAGQGRAFAIAPVAIAAEYPKPGEPLQSCGYGSDGQYWCNQGRALGYARTATTTTYETLELSGRARDGDSGGPVFNERGELVAVLWGTDGRIVGGTYCCRVRTFLGGLFPRLRDRFAGRAPPQRTQPAGPLMPVRPTQPGAGTVEVIGGHAEPTNPEPPVPSNGIAPENPAGPCCPSGTCPGLNDLRGSLAAIGGRLAAIEERQKEANVEASTERGKLDVAVTAIGKLRERIDAARSAGAGGAGEIARDVAEGVVRDRGGDLLSLLLPGLLAGLGWTGPPAIAAVLGLRVMAGLVRRRRQKQTGTTPSAPAGKEQEPAAPGASFCGSIPRNTTEAAQILRLAQAEGRDPLLDALVGRLTLDRLDNLVDAGGRDADWAASLRRELMDRVNQIAPVAL